MKGKSLRLLSRQPYGKKVIRIFKNLAILAFRRPNRFISEIIDDVLEITESALLTSPQSTSATHREVAFSVPQLSKNQYIAIVGTDALHQSTIYEVALQKKFSKSNIFICDNLEFFKNGQYSEKLKSDSCVAIIFGGIPHSHKGNVEKEYADKVVFARTNSGTHGKLKLTKNTLSSALDTVLHKIT